MVLQSSAQGDPLGVDGHGTGIYETVRSEVRRAISEIQNDLERVCVSIDFYESPLYFPFVISFLLLLFFLELYCRVYDSLPNIDRNISKIEKSMLHVALA